MNDSRAESRKSAGMASGGRWEKVEAVEISGSVEGWDGGVEEESFVGVARSSVSTVGGVDEFRALFKPVSNVGDDRGSALDRDKGRQETAVCLFGHQSALSSSVRLSLQHSRAHTASRST